MTDYLWHGDPTAIANYTTTSQTDDVTKESVKTPKAGLSIIGPRILDGIAYVNVRTDQELTIPEGVSVTGPELSAAVIGIWYETKQYINEV